MRSLPRPYGTIFTAHTSSRSGRARLSRRTPNRANPSAIFGSGYHWDPARRVTGPSKPFAASMPPAATSFRMMSRKPVTGWIESKLRRARPSGTLLSPLAIRCWVRSWGARRSARRTWGKATSAAKAAGKAMQQSDDLGTAHRELDGALGKFTELEIEFQAEVEEIEATQRPEGLVLQTLELAPGRPTSRSSRLFWPGRRGRPVAKPSPRWPINLCWCHVLASGRRRVGVCGTTVPSRFRRSVGCPSRQSARTPDRSARVRFPWFRQRPPQHRSRPHRRSRSVLNELPRLG